MDLKHLLKDFPELSQFDEQHDAKEALELFKMVPMKLPGLELIYDRSPYFNGLLSCQADEKLTIIGRLQGKLEGFASISWGPRWINGQKKNVSYLGDLRVAPVKGASQIWKSFYPKLLDYAREELNVDYQLNAILADNRPAMRALVDESSTTRVQRKFKYHFLHQTTMVNVLATKPFRPVLKSFRIRKVATTFVESEGILDFMDTLEKKKHFGYCLKDGEWARRLKSWPLLKDSFIYVLENEKEILATCLPWSTSSVKRLKVQNLSPVLKLSFKLAAFFGFNFPKNGEALKIPYLTHLYFAQGASNEEKALMMVSLLDEVKKEKWIKESNFISFDDAWELRKEKVFKRYLLQTTAVNIYAVTRDNETLPSELKGSMPGFEMALA